MPKLRQAILDPRWMIRAIYVGRCSIATGVFLAAQLVWNTVAPGDARAALLIFAATMLVTVVSAGYSRVHGAPLSRTFLYLQSVYDLLLVTAVVHVTGGAASQFAALYILVIACAALLLPPGGGLLIAALGNVCYFADVLWWHANTAPDVVVWLQLAVFATVALGSAYISARLQEAGEGTAAQLAAVRLHAEDILRNIRSGIVTIDAKGTLLYANPAAESLLGIPFGELMGTPVLPRLRAVAPTVARALERAAIDRARTTRAEEMIRNGDEKFPIGLTTTFSEGDGPAASTTATAIFQDISGQKRLESLHVRAGRLEAIAELSASLAHEIKNPLACIRSAVEQLTEILARQPRRRRAADDDAQALGALVERESDRLARLLTEFIDFARVRVTRLTQVDIGSVARGAANLAAAHPDCKPGVRVTCLTPEAPIVIEGDEDLLHRAAFNLALNAVQAAPAGGEVQLEVLAVETEHLPSGVTYDNGAVALRVSDNGPGIAADVRDRLFDPFITTKPGGSGLGLPVVHRAIEAHRGCVLVDTGGVGTRFTVLLPYAQSDEGTRSAIEAQEPWPPVRRTSQPLTVVA
jgi:two-component system sensor histidine kinase PilS (NtrC family)